MEYENGDGSALLYLFTWAFIIFIGGSTWHLWRYLNDGDSHSVIHAKSIHIAFCSFIGAMIGVWLTGFLLLVGYLIDLILELTDFGVMNTLGTTGVLIVFFASTQVSASMIMLGDGDGWEKYLDSND